MKVQERNRQDAKTPRPLNERLVSLASLFLASWRLGGFILLWCASQTGAAVVSFEDIAFWTGEGKNKAAMVIDWSRNPNEGDPTVWGYRWPENETLTGRDMLRAVLEADDRLFAKFDSLEARLFGLGYDTPGSAAPFALEDGTQFDSHGIAHTGEPPGTTPTDSADSWREGWAIIPIRSDGFWHYGIADGSPYATNETWMRSSQGFATRELTDGGWDGWTFDPFFASNAFPDPPENAALPSVVLSPGDYNGDGVVDAADYTVWRNSLGESVAAGSGADGDSSGEIDHADYLVWRAHFGASSGVAASQLVPEPTSASVLALFAVTVSVARWKTPKRGQRTRLYFDV